MDGRVRAKLHPEYKGELKVSGMLLKHKQNTGLGSIFKSFVARYFVLDITNFTFGYYKDINTITNSYIISIAVLIFITLGYYISFFYASHKQGPKRSSNRV